MSPAQAPAKKLELPLSLQVRECMDAEMRVEDGAKYVGIYADGYSLVATLIRISRFHLDSQVQARASRYLAKFDQQGGIGGFHQEAYAFAVLNKLKASAAPRKIAVPGLIRLRLHERKYLDEFADRGDIEERDRNEAKRIKASISDDRVATVDRVKLRGLIVKYRGDKVRRPGRAGNGFRKLSEKVRGDVATLLARPDVNDADKKQAAKLIGGATDGKMKTADFIAVTQLVLTNRATKVEIAKRATASRTFENALLVACQACYNLDDMKVPVLPEDRRGRLVARISGAAARLLRLQSQLIKEDER
jgi:hypothetical protein